MLKPNKNPLSFILHSPGLVSPDFALEIEVYCSVPTEDATAKPSTPIKVLKKLRHKVCMCACYVHVHVS